MAESWDGPAPHQAAGNGRCCGTDPYGCLVPPVVVLVPSPVLGPASWRLVEQALQRAGWPTIMPAASGPVRTGPDVLAGMLAAVPADREVVVVAHSNAGVYVPALVTRRAVVAAVFVDALLPAAAGGPVPLAPPALLEFLRARADTDGLLPPWTDWWDDTDVAALFPDAHTRALIEREQPRVPLSYFESSLTVPPDWDQGPMAYLAFGDTYTAQRADAESRGWPTATLAGEHLHMLIDPTQATQALTALLARLGILAPLLPLAREADDRSGLST